MEHLTKLLFGLPIAIVANIILGIALSNLKHEFSFEILKVGVIKGILVYVSIGLLVYLGMILPELSVMIVNENYTLQGAIELGLFGSVMYYAVQSIMKLFKILNSKLEVIPFGVEQEEIEQEDQIAKVG